MAKSNVNWKRYIRPKNISKKKKRKEKWVEEGSKDNLKNKRKRKFLENRGKKGLENILRNRNKEIIKKKGV